MFGYLRGVIGVLATLVSLVGIVWTLLGFLDMNADYEYPARPVVTGFAIALLGVVLTILWFGLLVYEVLRKPRPERKVLARVLIALQGVVLGFLLIPCGFMVVVAGTEMPKNLERLRRERIGSMGSRGKAVVPKLVEVMERPEEDYRARLAALQSLSLLGPKAKEAVPTLVKAMRDENEFVRSAALEALVNVGPGAEPAIPDLVQEIEARPDDLVFSYQGTRALQAIGRPAVPALAGLLSSKSADTRRLAADALWGIGPEAKGAVPQLRETLTDEDERVRESAQGALDKITR